MSLRVWLPLNGNLNNQGLTDVTVTNNGATIDNNGKIGKCYSFDGNDDYIQYTGLNVSGYNELSVCFWVYFTSSLKNVFGLSDPNGYWQFIINNNTLEIRDNGTGQSGTRKSYSLGTNTANTWIHFCCTYNKGVVNIYRNGVLLSSNNTGGSYFNSNVNICTVGSNWISGSTTYCFPGKLNDFRIYDHALSELEIKEIARAKVLHYPLNNNGIGNKNLLTNDWNLTTWNKESSISVSWDDTVGMYKVLDSSHTSSRWGIYQDITLTANTTYTFSVDGMKKDQNVNFGFAEGTSWPTNAGSFTTTVSRLSKTITVGSADANCRIYLNINPVSNGSNYGYFRAPKLEIGSVATPWGSHTDNTIEYDISGYCNNGTKIGTFTYSTDTPKYRVSTSFDGTNAIKYTNFNLGNIWSAGLWFNAASNITSGWESLFAVNNNGGDSDLKMNLYLNTSNGNIQYSANGQYIVVSLAAPNKNTWYHLFETFDGTTLSCYVNGVLKTTKTITNTEFTRSNLYISGRSSSTDGSTSGNKFHGKLSDFRIYATALSAQDILSLYHNSALVDEQGIIHGAIH